MHKTVRSYLLSITLTALFTSCLCAREAPIMERNIAALGVGDSLPMFQLTDTQYQSIDLHEILLSEPLVLIYYRGGW